MKNIRYASLILALATLAGLSLTLGGCKAQQQMQQQLGDLDSKLQQATSHITAMDAELKKTNFEVSQLKGLVTKLGNVTVDLQRAEEERQKIAAEVRARTEAAKKKPIAKAVVKKAPPKKKK